MLARIAQRRRSANEMPLDAAWSMQHIPVFVATRRRDVGVREYGRPPHYARLYFIVSRLLLACAGRHPVTQDTLAAAPPETTAPEPVVLEVENHNWADVVLYVLHDGVQTRFPQVAAAHSVSIEIPTRLHQNASRHRGRAGFRCFYVLRWDRNLERVVSVLPLIFPNDPANRHHHRRVAHLPERSFQLSRPQTNPWREIHSALVGETQADIVAGRCFHPMNRSISSSLAARCASRQTAVLLHLV